MTNSSGLIRITNGSALDRAGVAASCACAAHCALMPALAGALPLLGLGFLANERAEWLLVALSAAVGVMSLLPSYLRRHRRTPPLATFSAGVTLIFAGHVWFEENEAAETTAVVAGALLIAVAHFVNSRLCRRRCAA